MVVVVEEVHEESYRRLQELTSTENERIPKAAVLFGPGGSGKTRLYKRFGNKEGYEVRELGVEEVGDSDCAVVQQRVMQTFRRAVERGRDGVRTMIVVDNVELWSGGTGGRGLVAGMHDGLGEVAQCACREVVVVCTAAEAGAVAAVGWEWEEVEVGVLREAERAALWGAVGRGGAGREDVDVVATTGGMTAADLCAVGRRVGRGESAGGAVRSTTASTLRAHADVVRRAGGEGGEFREAAAAALRAATAVATGRAARGVGAAAGAVLVGRSGSGKTRVLRAAVRAAGGLLLHATAVASWRVGAGERRLRAAFGAARALRAGDARAGVLGVDDVERVAPARGGGGGGGGGGAEAHESARRLLATLLAELDAGGVVVLAATRNIAAVDPALLRAGRVDVLLPLP